MLGNWRSHADYLAYMVPLFMAASENDPNITKEYMTAFQKVYILNLDLVWEEFLPEFPFVGRPSDKQPEILRSFVLMSHFKYDSIDNWVTHARATPIICMLIGVEPNEMPGASTHRDFYKRFWRGPTPDPIKFVPPKPKKKPGKNKKLPPKNPDIINKMADKAIKGETFSVIPERLYQAIFMKLAVIPSAELGLLGDTNNLIVETDGSCVSSNANSNGHSLDPQQYPVESAKGYRMFADPVARWGWDSYHNDWYYGYTMYLLSVHNPDLKIDLPIYLRFVDANRFDGITFIAAVAHARSLFEGIFRLKYITADSAHDNYATYRMLKSFNIIPVIDLNKRGTKQDNKNDITAFPPPKTSGLDDAKPTQTSNVSGTVIPFPEYSLGRRPSPKIHKCEPVLIRPDGVPISENGKPICRVGIEMTNCGFDKKRSRTKFRCPLMAGSISSCIYSNECNPTDYGKIVFTKPDDDPRLNTVVPRGSDEWKKLYNNRTAAERINTRILTDYQLERRKRYGKMKLYFFTFSILLNLHLDDQIRFTNFKNVFAPWKIAV